MGREFHVRFCEGLGVQFPRATRLIITGISENLLKNEVKPLVERFLRERGLELSHEKTRITRLQDGFDFLGQTIRRYDNGKVLIKPSKKSVKTFLAGIQEVIKEQGGHCTAWELIGTLNAKIKGWTAYHRHACSKRTFSYIDKRIFRMIWRWCRRRHRKKPLKWIKEKYFKRSGDRNWVFSSTRKNKEGKTRYRTLQAAAGVSIQRHVQIRGGANPYDMEWEEYFEKRLYEKMRSSLKGRGQIAYIYCRQGGRCGGCGQLMNTEDELQIHHRVRRSDGGDDSLDNLELLHANCHRQKHSNECDEADCVSREAFEEA